jgi:hypothetical protein
MTMALCLYCGRTKFGALVPCPYCHTQGTGHMMLDIKFSDHNFSGTKLKALGEVIERIRTVCPNDQERYDAFFHFVESSNPKFLQTTLDPAQRRNADVILAKARVRIGEIDLTPRGRLDFFGPEPARKATPPPETLLPNVKQRLLHPAKRLWQWLQKKK